MEKYLQKLDCGCDTFGTTVISNTTNMTRIQIHSTAIFIALLTVPAQRMKITKKRSGMAYIKIGKNPWNAHLTFV